jgi:hypothetical protein
MLRMPLSTEKYESPFDFCTISKNFKLLKSYNSSELESEIRKNIYKNVKKKFKKMPSVNLS